MGLITFTRLQCISNVILSHLAKKSLTRENNNTIFPSKSRFTREEKNRLIYFGLIVGISVVCFSNSITGDFVHDDLVAITRNKDISRPTETPWSNLIVNDFWGRRLRDPKSHRSYRPLTGATFRLNFIFSGESPSSYHAINIILHAINTFLFILVCEKFGKMKLQTTAIAGLIFAVHPIHCEAVSSIVGRAELLSAFFFFTSLLFYERCLPMPGRSHEGTSMSHLFVSLLSATFATLAKEQGATVLGIMVLHESCLMAPRSNIRLLFRKRKLSSTLWATMKRAITISYSVLLILVFRLWLMGFQLPSFACEDSPASFQPLFPTRLMSYLHIYVCNIWLLMCPSKLSYDWQMGSIPLVKSFYDPRNILSVLMVLVLVLLTRRCWKKVNAERQVLLLGLGLLLIPFIPAANLLFPVGFVMAERVLYLPSCGYAILLTYGIDLLCNHLPKYRNIIISMMLILQCFSGVRTISRNQVWHSRETLFRSGVQVLPNNAKMYYNYGNYLKDLGGANQTLAKNYYEEAIRLWPEYASAYNNLGTLMSNQKEAEAMYLKAIQMNPEHAGAFFNLGNLYFKQKNLTSSMTSLRQAVNLDPVFAEAYTSLGLVLNDLGLYPEAEHNYKIAVKLRPSDPNTHNNLGVFYANQGQQTKALDCYQRAYTSNPDHHISIINAARVFHTIGKQADALTLFKRALKISRDMDTLKMAGIFFYNINFLQEAADTFKEYLKADDSNSQVLVYYAQTLSKQSEFARAERILHHVSQSNPADLNILIQLANVYGLDNKHQESVKLLTSSLNKLTELSRVEAEKLARQPGWSQGCGRSFDECIATLHFNLANHYKDLGNMNQAFQNYLMTVEYNKQHSEAHLNLGVFYHLKEKFHDAEKHYQVAKSLSPQNPLIQENLEKLHSKISLSFT